MKTTSLFTFFIIIIGLISCKKEAEPVPNLSHFEGNFLCDVDYNYYYNGNNSIDYDKVVRCYIENDSLKVLNYAFAFHSDDQTVFFKNLYGNSTIKVTFSSQYNAISIEGDFPSQLSGPESNVTYTGMRTSLPETTHPHPCLDELEGVYDLDIYYRNDVDSIDTQYVLTNPISMSGNYVSIDPYQFYTPHVFHSYLDQSVAYTSNSGTQRHKRSIQWSNNSINLNYRTVLSNPWIPVPNDTIHHIISGTK